MNRDGEEASTPKATPIIPVVCFDTDGLFDYECMFAGQSIRYVPDINSHHYGGPDQYIDTMIRRVKQVDIEHHVLVFTYNIDSFLVGPSVIIYAGRPSDSEPVLANDWGWRVSSKDDIDRVDDNVALDVLERRGEEITALKQLALDNDLSHVCPGDPEAEAAYLEREERNQRPVAKIDPKDCRSWDCTTLICDKERTSDMEGTWRWHIAPEKPPSVIDTVVGSSRVSDKECDMHDDSNHDVCDDVGEETDYSANLHEDWDYYHAMESVEEEPRNHASVIEDDLGTGSYNGWTSHSVSSSSGAERHETRDDTFITAPVAGLYCSFIVSF